MQPGPKPTKWKAKLKRWLAESPLPYSITLDSVNRLARLNDWRKQHPNIPYFASRSGDEIARDQLYTYLIDQIGDQEITYLEFGVYRGDSMRYWTHKHRNPRSQFFGFDTFEGLPESWGNLMKKGDLSTDGNVPKIDDPRVRFFKGLFQDTLPSFLVSNSLEGKRLVINNDSDLYSSTLFTLCSLHPLIRKGTVIVFDEFSSILHEFRAAEDYFSTFRRKYEVVAASGQFYDQVAIQLVE